MSDVEANDTEVSAATLRLERLIPSPPELLFDLWTQPAQLVRWWGAEGYETLVHTLDVRPGGRWRIALRGSDDSVMTTSGVYRVVEPPRLIAFTWAWEGPGQARGHETEVVVTFDPAPGGTRLVLVQQRFESQRARDGHDAGWSAAFDRLAAITV